MTDPLFERAGIGPTRQEQYQFYSELWATFVLRGHMPAAPNIRLNPAFRRFPEEAAIIGRLVVGFGELEFAVCRNAGQALRFSRPQMFDEVMKTLYRVRTTSSRLEVADGLTKFIYIKEALAFEYSHSVECIKFCHNVRNQYAHCNWLDNPDHVDAGLFFVDLQGSAESNSIEFGDHNHRHVDIPILRAQEEFFSNTLEWLDYLNHELATRQGRLDRNLWPRPAELPPPPRHNPPAAHVPPWLSEERKALHVARALAAQGGPPTPTLAQQALDAARTAKKSRREEHNRRSREGNLRTKESSDPPKE